GGRPRIRVTMTTQNRNDVLDATGEKMKAVAPATVPELVVDDVSICPGEGAVFRASEIVVNARAKNKAMEVMYVIPDVDHFFLFDDDAWPLVEGWWRPYVESPEPHLMAIFDKPKGATKSQVEVLYRDDRHVAYHATRGYMLYAHRSVLDRVGGMDPE